MPHCISTDSFKMAERIQVGKLQHFNQDVRRSINVNRYSSDYQRVKEVS